MIMKSKNVPRTKRAVMQVLPLRLLLFYEAVTADITPVCPLQLMNL